LVAVVLLFVVLRYTRWGYMTRVIGGNAEADYLLGITGLAIHDQTFNGPVSGRRWKIYRPFIEDDWRVTSALVLNLGLAWDMTTPITEAHGRMANYVPATGQLLIANQNGVSASAGVKMDWTALEPRIGGTWKVMGSEKTVLRAGYGIFYTPDVINSYRQLAFQEPFGGISSLTARPADPQSFASRHATLYDRPQWWRR
jgi:hypothetical protein